jgi:manganese/zinc/iron transport system ATP- binding protein
VSAPRPTPAPGGDDDAGDGLVLRDLTVAYPGKLVLRGVSADIRRGQVVGLIGPNGGGKSTLLMAILGIVPIVRGTVTLFGRPAATMRARIAYVPQRELVDWEFPVTVREVVMMGRYPRIGWLGRPGRHDEASVDAVLERVSMGQHRGSQIGQLSGGQQQRVFIARALAHDADLLLLDEPMVGIDAATQEVIVRIIDEQRRAGKIVVLATHDLAGASCTCDCLCCLNGRLVSFGPWRETYTAEVLAATYGGPVIVLAPGGAVIPHHGGEPAHHAPGHQGAGGGPAR